MPGSSSGNQWFSKMQPRVEEIADGVAAWAAKKNEIEWVRLFGSRITGKRSNDGCPPVPESDLDIAIELDAELVKRRYADGQHSWSDETDPRNAFIFDNATSWRNELNSISPWNVDLNFVGQDTSNLYEYLESGSFLVYERSRSLLVLDK